MEIKLNKSRVKSITYCCDNFYDEIDCGTFNMDFEEKTIELDSTDMAVRFCPFCGEKIVFTEWINPKTGIKLKGCDDFIR